jgi:hypothetical protein
MKPETVWKEYLKRLDRVDPHAARNVQALEYRVRRLPVLEDDWAIAVAPSLRLDDRQESFVPLEGASGVAART